MEIQKAENITIGQDKWQIVTYKISGSYFMVYKYLLEQEDYEGQTCITFYRQNEKIVHGISSMKEFWPEPCDECICTSEEDMFPLDSHKLPRNVDIETAVKMLFSLETADSKKDQLFWYNALSALLQN